MGHLLCALRHLNVFSHLFNKHLWSTYCMLGTVPDAWGTVVSKTHQVPALITPGGRYYWHPIVQMRKPRLGVIL